MLFGLMYILYLSHLDFILSEASVLVGECFYIL